MVIIKTLIFTLLLPGVFLVLVPYFLLSWFGDGFTVEIGSFRYFGVLPVLLGILIYIQCAWSFASLGKGTPAPIDPPKELVVKALYKYVRNPMYLGVLFLLIGEVIFFGSLLIFLYSALVFLCFHIIVVIYEEPHLRARFGDLYNIYCDSVPRWIPRWRKTRKKGWEHEK